MSPPTIPVTAAAQTASLAHVLIDHFIGLSGGAVDGSPAVTAMLFVGLATHEPALQA